MQTPTRTIFLHIPAWEQALFYVLIAASLAVMASQYVGMARRWMQGRPIGWGGPLREGPRYWLPTAEAARTWLGRLWEYVLLQRKVRTSRRKSGAPMHVAIFYGFLAMFVATSLLAVAKYGPFNFHRGNYYLWYEATFDILGLLLIVGVGWAIVRRIREAQRGVVAVEAARAKNDPNFSQQLEQNRRHPLSHAAPDLWMLGVLFAVGITGYWLEAARISNDPKPWDHWSVVGYAWAQLQGPMGEGAYRFVWWFHMAWIAVFFAVLPKMRLRHVLSAVASTAGAPPAPMGELRKIPMEEVEETGQVGVALAKDYSRWHLMSLDACMECGRCTEVCPAWNVGKVLNPKQVVQDVRGALVTGDGVAARVTEEALWQCTTCNACVEACPVLIRHVDLIVDARRYLVAEGKLSGSGATMLRQVGSTGHAWGQPSGNREDWMKGLEVPLCRDGVEFEWLFWVGCAGATDPGAVRTTKAVAKLLAQAGIRFACLGNEETCTGDPARRIGDEFTFQAQAEVLKEIFAAYGVKKVLTPCPHCFNTFAHEYRQFGVELEVVHHSQMLADLVAQGKLKAPKLLPGSTAYHDPCYLARVNNEADAPRRALGLASNLNALPHVPERNGGPLAEPEHYARKTLCCGAGGGRMWMDEPPTERPANRRMDELAETGAETVVLGCPFCRIMLGAAAPSNGKELKLVDLAEVLSDANGTAETGGSPP